MSEVTPGRLGEPYSPQEVADIKQIAREKRAGTWTWVCDGCMRTVTADQVADFADYEHVLCRRCREA